MYVLVIVSSQRVQCTFSGNTSPYLGPVKLTLSDGWWQLGQRSFLITESRQDSSTIVAVISEFEIFDGTGAVDVGVD